MTTIRILLLASHRKGITLSRWSTNRPSLSCGKKLGMQEKPCKRREKVKLHGQHVRSRFNPHCLNCEAATFYFCCAIYNLAISKCLEVLNVQGQAVSLESIDRWRIRLRPSFRPDQNCHKSIFPSEAVWPAELLRNFIFDFYVVQTDGFLCILGMLYPIWALPMEYTIQLLYVHSLMIFNGLWQLLNHLQQMLLQLLKVTFRRFCYNTSGANCELFSVRLSTIQKFQFERI